MKFIIELIKKWLFRDQLNELNKIGNVLDKRLAEPNFIYTTIRSFRGIDAEYYGWIRDTLMRDEYRFMLLDLRENVFREMALETEKDNVLRHLGRLDMIGVIDNYLNNYKREYENSVRRNQEESEKQPNAQ